MRSIFGFLALAAGIYSTLIFIRVILSWFSTTSSGRLVEFLNKITDPYLNWWRTNFKLQLGHLDFSVVAAIVSLSLLQSIFHMIYAAGRITIGSLLSIVLLSIWSILSFIIGFCLVIIVLRGIAYFTNRNIYSPFWGMIDSISKPILYRFNRLLNINRTGNYLNVIVISCLIMIGVMIFGRILVLMLANILQNLPV